MTSWGKVHWALAVSLGLNLLVAGAVAGAILSGGPDRREGLRAASGPPEISALARGLDRSERRALFRALRADPELRGRRGEMAAAQLALAAAIRAEPFDQADFLAASGALRGLRADLSERGAVAVSELLADLDADRRAALADLIEAAVARRAR